jgi:hypothetical protein
MRLAPRGMQMLRTLAAARPTMPTHLTTARSLRSGLPQSGCGRLRADLPIILPDPRFEHLETVEVGVLAHCRSGQCVKGWAHRIAEVHLARDESGRLIGSLALVQQVQETRTQGIGILVCRGVGVGLPGQSCRRHVQEAVQVNRDGSMEDAADRSQPDPRSISPVALLSAHCQSMNNTVA